MTDTKTIPTKEEFVARFAPVAFRLNDDCKEWTIMKSRAFCVIMPSGREIRIPNFYATLYDFITKGEDKYEDMRVKLNLSPDAVKRNLDQVVKFRDDYLQIALCLETTVSPPNRADQMFYCDVLTGVWSCNNFRATLANYALLGSEIVHLWTENKRLSKLFLAP